MTILLTIIHIIVCFFLVVVVLLQSGKAADLAGAFGGMGSQTAFGPRGSATVLSKATTIAAAMFMVTSLSLAILTTRNAGNAGSVLDRQKKGAPAKTNQTTAPGSPAQPNGLTQNPGVPQGSTPINITPIPLPPGTKVIPPPAQKAPAPKK